MSYYIMKSVNKKNIFFKDITGLTSNIFYYDDFEKIEVQRVYQIGNIMDTHIKVLVNNADRDLLRSMQGEISKYLNCEKVITVYTVAKSPIGEWEVISEENKSVSELALKYLKKRLDLSIG